MGKEREDYPWEIVYSPGLKVGMSVLSHLTSRGTGKCDLPLYSEQTGEMGLAKQITVLCHKGWGLAPRKDCPALWGAQHLSPKADVPQEPLSLNVLWLYPALCPIHSKGSVKYFGYPVSETEMLIPLGHLARSSGSTARVLVPPLCPLCPLCPCTPGSSGGPWIWAHGVCELAELSCFWCEVVE